MLGSFMLTSIPFVNKTNNTNAKFGYAMEGYLTHALGANDEVVELAANVGSWGVGAAGAYEAGMAGAAIGSLGRALGVAGGVILEGL